MFKLLLAHVLLAQGDAKPDCSRIAKSLDYTKKNPTDQKDVSVTEKPADKSTNNSKSESEPRKPSEPSREPREPSEPSRKPSEPSREPREPSREPREPSREPREPSGKPSEPSRESRESPRDPRRTPRNRIEGRRFLRRLQDWSEEQLEGLGDVRLFEGMSNEEVLQYCRELTQKEKDLPESNAQSDALPQSDPQGDALPQNNPQSEVSPSPVQGPSYQTVYGKVSFLKVGVSLFGV